MLIETLKNLFARDLARLRNEIELYTKEENNWKVEEQIANSAGNLCLHLVGNLNTFIGKELGHTGYVRHRELEFSQKHVPRETLLAEISNTMNIVAKTLGSLDPAVLETKFPVKVFAEETTTGYMLVHLATHLSYHLGQVNYHRRLLDQ